MSDQRRGLLLADVGKTRCRLRLVSPDGAQTWAVAAEGAPGLAVAGADELVARCILDLAQTRPDTAPTIDRIAVGAAGALAAPSAADALAGRLSRALGAPALVTSDIVTAHLGAFGGRTGTVLVAGTGAVALGISSDGATTLVDGRGPELGDLGSGAWIGRAGIIAALRAGDRAASPTGLEAALDGALSAHQDIHTWLAAGGNLGGRLGEFAPVVLRLAEDGDPVAAGIADEAARLLAETATAAGETTVSVLGGLVEHPWFRRRLVHRLVEAGLTPIQPLGTALDGALVAVVSESLPHERHFHRA